MIKLNFHMLDEALAIEHMTILSIEDTRLFTAVTESLYFYEEDGLVKLFYDDQQNLSANKVVVITDILAYDLNTTSVVKSVTADVVRQISEKPELKTEIERLMLDLEDLIREEIVDHDLELGIEPLDLSKILKSIRLKVESRNDLFRKIQTILEVHHYIDKNVLLIFINTLSYFEQEEIESIREYISLNNLNALFLEPKRVACFSQYCLDKDFFLMSV